MCTANDEAKLECYTEQNIRLRVGGDQKAPHDAGYVAKLDPVQPAKYAPSAATTAVYSANTGRALASPEGLASGAHGVQGHQPA